MFDKFKAKTEEFKESVKDWWSWHSTEVISIGTAVIGVGLWAGSIVGALRYGCEAGNVYTMQRLDELEKNGYLKGVNPETGETMSYLDADAKYLEDRKSSKG